TLLGGRRGRRPRERIGGARLDVPRAASAPLIRATKVAANAPDRECSRVESREGGVPNPPPSLRLLWTRSPTARALVLAVLVLLLQIPVFLVSGIAREREARRNDVVHAIGEQ